MPSKDERLRWHKRLQEGGSQKVIYVLQVHAGVQYRATQLRAEWFPRLNKWRAVQMVGKVSARGVTMRPKYLAEFPSSPELRDFTLAEVMIFLEATYELSQSSTGVEPAPDRT